MTDPAYSLLAEAWISFAPAFHGPLGRGSGEGTNHFAQITSPGQRRRGGFGARRFGRRRPDLLVSSHHPLDAVIRVGGPAWQGSRAQVAPFEPTCRGHCSSGGALWEPSTPARRSRTVRRWSTSKVRLRARLHQHRAGARAGRQGPVGSGRKVQGAERPVDRYRPFSFQEACSQGHGRA